MIDFKKYQRGRINNIKVYFTNSSLTWGQDTITHKYPKSGRTEVEFMGLNKKRFSTQFLIENEFYFSKRKEILKELNRGEYITIIHPIDGELKVAVAEPYSVVENDNELGFARFSVVFQEVSDKTAPDKKKSLFSQVINGINEALETSNEIINDNYVVSFLNSITKAQQQILGITEEVGYQASKIFSDDGILGDINSLIESFENDPFGVISTAENLASFLTNLLNIFSRGGTNQDNATAFISMFNLGDDIPTTDLTLSDKENKQNTEAINVYSQFQYLLYTYNNGLNIQFLTKEEVDNFINALDIQYNKLYDSLGVDLQDQIDTLRAQLYEYLRALDLFQIVEVKTQNQSLEALVYQYYGNLDLYDTIKNINNLVNPAFCNTNMEILEKWN